MPMRKLFGLVVLGGLGAVFGALPALAQAPTQAPAQTPAHSAAATVQAGAGFSAGPAQTCLKCHGNEPGVAPILQTPHAMRGDPHSPFGQNGCESCHGDSSAHVASRANKPAVIFRGPNISSVKDRNEICLSCHESGMRMNWQGSAHEINNKACTDCHTMHVAKDPILVRFSQSEQCFSCHARQRADSFKYSHHPMREGKVICSDCHNPHGSPAGEKLLKEFTVNETCYNCHAEKRGPLLWEHQPVRDNCLNCHTPHGSNEARLMKERMNFLCSSCHSAESNNSGGAFGGAHSIPFRGPGSSFFNSALANQRTCLNCHSQVHGSNSPAGAFFFR
jgi:DmsE family decaheme c-type cytochrome